MREYWVHLNRTLHKDSHSIVNHCHIVTNIQMHKLGPLLTDHQYPPGDMRQFFVEEYESRTGTRITEEYQLKVYTINEILKWQGMDDLARQFALMKLGVTRDPLQEMIHIMIMSTTHKQITVLVLDFFDQLTLIKSQHFKVHIANEALWIGDPSIAEQDCLKNARF